MHQLGGLCGSHVLRGLGRSAVCPCVLRPGGSGGDSGMGAIGQTFSTSWLRSDITAGLV